MMKTVFRDLHVLLVQFISTELSTIHTLIVRILTIDVLHFCGYDCKLIIECALYCLKSDAK